MSKRSSARPWLLCLLPALLGAAGIAGQAAHAGTQSTTLAPGRIERDSRRFETLNTAALWELLAVKPGMTILDIGTGTGQFAYAFAARLQGRGRVFATDINEGCVMYVREQAAKRGLGNLLPVLVRKDGLDEFYRSERYDLIAIFHVLLDHAKEVEFLRQIRSSLAADGRLVLLLYKEFPEFSSNDFTDDAAGLALEILREHLDTPFYRAIRDSTRELLRTQVRAGSAAAVAGAVAEDFNAILADANFGMGFHDGAAFGKELDFTREERDYAEWLGSARNTQTGTRGVRGATWVSAHNARLINKLLIIQKFRKYLKSERLYAPGLSPASREAFAAAGYSLQREYTDIVPFEDIVVYTRAH